MAQAPEIQAPEIASPPASPHEANSPHQADSQAVALRLVLTLSARQVAVYRGDVLLSRYPVAIGREGWQTPTGEFSVFQKQTDPAWEHPFTGEVIPPGPENPLGTRWIGFWSDGVNAIGFHGTPDESVIGSAVSHGCVRMRNADVMALYEQVGMGTLVTVLP
ncbi:MAG: L,D-transpeptidase [Phormidesmis sp. RL_2_1]|nr:L,D-transpeptidase [Phormidesmis sp. RL_2_1]